MLTSSLQDLNSLGVSVDPYFISKPEEEFDQDYYWNVGVMFSRDCHILT
jgi:hypothetical protein